MTIQLAGVLPSSLVNGEGIRTVLFFSGCSFSCKGCHNNAYRNIDEGCSTSLEEILSIINANSIANKKRITLSGGDPFFQADKVSELACILKADHYNIWCYTGHTIEDLIASKNPHYMKLLQNIDVLVDGQFDYLKTKNAPKYAGSSNQRIIDVQKTLKNKKVCLLVS